jgi:glycerol-3-phosphate acyltransferase PlsX
VHRIALDVMGGDGAPRAPIEGALAAMSEAASGLEILLVGDPAAIANVLPDPPHPGLRVVPATETIAMGEAPAHAVRRKKDSSIVVGLGLQRDGEVDAFISAGSTGAVMAASLLILKRLPGVDRPAIGAVFPTAGSPTLVLDSGANMNVRPGHLRQFAHLGSIYIADLMGIERPRVGLLNVGMEEAKGDELAVAAFELLRSDEALNLVGNVEGHQIIEGVCDVLVCGGFVGNVLLKFYESIAGFVLKLLHGESHAGQNDTDLERVFRVLDYAEYGGAPLLGVNGVSIVCHGSSSPRAIKNAIGVAVRALESGLIGDMAHDLASLHAVEVKP